MSSTTLRFAGADSSAHRLIRAGVLVSIVDGLFATAFGLFVRGVSAARMWQGVASVPLGKAALDGGMTTVGAGLALHMLVAFTWSGLLLMAVRRSYTLRAVIDSPYGILKVAAVLGPVIWLVMSLVVIPTMTHRLPAFTPAYFEMLVGHIFFVGIPMVWGIGT
ncbi:MAG: hypothetical protein M3Z05_00420 [Gemmatimonadota bacterium]|nr:hypothetical protein [Gemmatimonadota bacterium]